MQYNVKGVTMMLKPNTEIIRQLYFNIISRRPVVNNTGAKNHGFTQYTVSARPSSLKAFESFFSLVADAFPDYNLSIESLSAKGDRVMVRYTITGTHRRTFMGIEPTNQRLTITGIDIFRLYNGKVVEHWDAAHQICALPTTGGEPALSSGVASRSTPLSRNTKKQLSLKT